MHPSSPINRSRLAFASQSYVLVVALLMLAARSASAGAVFEVREVVAQVDSDLQFQFTDIQTFEGLGSIARSGMAGAGLVFNTSAIPLAIFTLNKCVAVAPHIHPNGAETVVALKGKLRVHQVRGEEGGNTLRSVDIVAGQAVYIQQGAFHAVENIAIGPSEFLQLFDHPQAGAVFVASSVLALPSNLVNAAFSEDLLAADAGLTANNGLISVRNCTVAY